MKYNIFKGILAFGAVTLLAGCSEDSWNDEHLDGFETPTIGQKETVQYTLTSGNYSDIAGKVGANISMATTNGVLDDLKAVGTKKYFTNTIQARDYIPAWLDSVGVLPGYPFCQLDNRSTIEITYSFGGDLPKEVVEIEKAPKYEVSEADYQAVYGSDVDYANAFSPSNRPERYIPDFLKASYPDAQEGDFVYVNYNISGQDPVFGGSGAVEEPFEMSDVLGTATPDVELTASCVVTAICTQGMIITDKGGSIFVYGKPGTDYTIGDQLLFTGVPTLQAKNNYYSITLADAIVEKKGHEEYTYPEPEVLDGAAAKARLDEMVQDGKNILPTFVQVTGEAAVSKSGDYFNYNMILEGVDANDCQISIYRPTDDFVSKIVDKTKLTMTGYLISRSSSRYVNVVPVTIDPAAAPKASKRVAQVASQNVSAVYTFNGTRWTAPSDITVLNDADYAAMGLSDLNATNAAQYLPIYLKDKYPYAKADDVMYVVFRYYDSSSRKTIEQHCDRFTFDGAAWSMSTIDNKMDRFVKKDGKWIYDPSLYITIPAVRNDATSLLQTCVDWVWENIDVKELGLTDAEKGQGYVDYRDNAEYYSGASRYYGNVDCRASTAKANAGKYYEGMSDEQITATIKSRFESQTLPGALTIAYPDAVPGDGVDLYYVITFTDYTSGSAKEQTARYLVTGRAKFEFVDCTWNEE